MSYLPILGRIMVGFYFAFFGFWNIYHWTPLLWIMTKKDIPHPYLFLSFGIMWQIIMGCMIIIGLYTKLAALLLIPFTLLSVFIFHTFWDKQHELRKLNMSLFVTNLTVTLGALLLLIGPIDQLADFLT